MKLSRLRHIIKEEIQSLMEVKPFIDPKLKSKPNDRIQYVATNDHRYPSEIAFIDTQKGEVVFFNIQRKEVERIAWNKLNSTHWVRDYIAKEFEGFGVKAVPIKTDIRFVDQVENAINKEGGKQLHGLPGLL